MPKTPAEVVEDLIREHGDDAYNKALDLTTMAVQIGDRGGEEIFSEAAVILMGQGYHKKKPLVRRANRIGDPVPTQQVPET